MRSVGLAAATLLLGTVCAGGLRAPTEAPGPPITAAAESVAPPGAATTPAAASAVVLETVVPPTVTPTSVASRVVTPTAVRTTAPTAVATPAVRAGAFVTLPPGAALPSDQQCANEIARDTWEPRPENRTANQTNAWTSGFRLRGSYVGSIATAYEQRVTGNFTGTTDQILRWAACKWGFDENDVRAQAVIESYWRQSTLGDCNRTTQPETKGCASVGILQVKGANIPATHPGTWPAAMTSTALNADYALAVRRLCFDGKETWMRQFNATYAAGDLWGCVGRWFSGRWHDAAAETYITRVRSTLNARTWASPSF